MITEDKLPGLDGITITALKIQKLRNISWQFFTKCLDPGKIPSEWSKAVICPIPKNNSDPTYLIIIEVSPYNQS